MGGAGTTLPQWFDSQTLCVRGIGERRDDIRGRRRGEYRRHRCLAQRRCGGPTNSSVVSVVVVILKP